LDLLLYKLIAGVVIIFLKATIVVLLDLVNMDQECWVRGSMGAGGVRELRLPQPAVGYPLTCLTDI
jgi:hypothetical protein